MLLDCRYFFKDKLIHNIMKLEVTAKKGKSKTECEKNKPKPLLDLRKIDPYFALYGEPDESGMYFSDWMEAQ